jgi:dGTPase
MDTLEKIQAHGVNLVGYSPQLGPKIRALKSFLYERMYRHYRLMRMQVKAERFIADIFEAYCKDPGMLPPDTQERLATAPVQRVVADYIAGMTDRYALDEHEKLFNPYRRV